MLSFSAARDDGDAEQKAEGRRKEMVMIVELDVGGELQVLGALGKREMEKKKKRELGPWWSGGSCGSCKCSQWHSKEEERG